MRKVLTRSFSRRAQVQGVVSSAHGNAIDRRAAVSDDAQTGGFSTVPEAGSAVSRAGKDISPPIHNGSVQNTCIRAKAAFRHTAWKADRQSTSFPEAN